MKTILAISVLLGVAVMMMTSALPATAQPNFETDGEVPLRITVPLLVESCEPTRHGEKSMCRVVVDSDRNGCDARDKRISIPATVVRSAGFGSC